MTSEDISTFYAANQTLITSLGALAGLAALLVAANRLRVMKEHRATLLVANILTVIAAALATAVSASGMWKFFTDILGETPLRIAFFAFIEIALFASALLARSRLLRDPQTGATGVDGIAVWVLAALTATLSALDSDSLREVCLRLVAPLIAAWMWERALAAERHVRLGKNVRRIHWAITPERIFVWLRLAEASDRGVSEVDHARRRTKLGQARLQLHLLQRRNVFAWRIRRAHRNVIKQAMQAAEHVGLADFPSATNEREAIQMYMATLYGFVDATSPQAVEHLNAWKHMQGPRRTNDTNCSADDEAAAPTAFDGIYHADNSIPTRTAPSANAETTGHRTPNLGVLCKSPEFNGPKPQPEVQSAAARDGNNELKPDEEPDGDHQPNAEADLTPAVIMRRLWDREVANGRVPTGAELSRFAGIPPATGLGRRKRREWQAELPEHFKLAAGEGRRPLERA